MFFQVFKLLQIEPKVLYTYTKSSSICGARCAMCVYFSVHEQNWNKFYARRLCFGEEKNKIKFNAVMHSSQPAPSYARYQIFTRVYVSPSRFQLYPLKTIIIEFNF